MAALNLGYLIKTYILFTSCYNAYCPEKKFGLYLLILSSVVLMVVSIFPDMKLVNPPNEVFNFDNVFGLSALTFQLYSKSSSLFFGRFSLTK